MNILKKENNKIVKLESYWKKSKSDNKKDDLDNEYPFPVEGKYWTDKEQFLDKLSKTEKYVLFRKGFHQFDEPEYCILCKNTLVSTGYYYLQNIIWKNSLIHYIQDHNIKPSNEFIDFIYQFDFQKDLKKNKDFEVLKMDGDQIMMDNIKYLKVNRNQILILDALMIHGGYNKKYFDSINNKNKNFRYSEHSGLLDFDQLGLDKIIISAKTSRIDEGDDEIYLPKNMKEAFDYEYIFHTHPPTPKPGSRAEYGILYDFPSINDMLHFIDHYNLGNTQGSLVIAPEGLYNVRKFKFDNEKINIIDEDEMIKRLTRVHNKIQENAIKKYGYKFTLNKFYDNIVQDFTFIDEYNIILHDYEIHIDYFPRIKDSKGNWYIDSVYLPVMVKEKL
jgi:hypothetical protein